MRAYVCLVILAVVSLPAHTFATEARSEVDNAPVALAVPATPKPLCRETVCPRLYMPVCGLVDGELVTLPSRCVLNNKIRCSSALQESLGKKASRVRFLHSGPCSPREENYASKEEDDVSNEEDDVSNEEDDVSNEEDDANNEDYEPVEIHDSGESGEFNALQHDNVYHSEYLEHQADLDDKEADADNSEAETDHAEAQEDSEEE